MDAIPAVDWTAAAALGATLVPPGPRLRPHEIATLVAGVRRSAARATDLVAAASQLDAPPPGDVLVVDRASWIRANAAMARVMVDSARDDAESTAPSLRRRVGARVSGAEIGAVLALVATRILGQFDPFGTPPRLLLVAPNLVAVERSLGVDPDDFRLWVCLHEETHRFQFGAAPWLPGHLLGLFGDVLRGEGVALTGWRPGASQLGDLVLSPAQRATLGDITAVMSLLEGHADVLMDRAGTGVIGSLATLRASFERRRDAGGLAQLIGRVLGLNLKREQYREGAAFCRTVLDAVGVAGLNRVFAGPESLPTLDELRDPDRWLTRMGA